MLGWSCWFGGIGARHPLVYTFLESSAKARSEMLGGEMGLWS